MSKDIFIQCHEELIGEYLEAHPSATEQEAYDATADLAWEVAVDRIADMADWAHEQAKEALYD